MQRFAPQGRGAKIVEIAAKLIVVPASEEGHRVGVLARRVARHELQILRRRREFRLEAVGRGCFRLKRRDHTQGRNSATADKDAGETPALQLSGPSWKLP